MPLDPKLRDVLDFLPCEPCLERPSPDQEVLCTICHRLNRTVALKCQVSLVSPPDAPDAAELDEARAEAREKQAEFEALRDRQEADDETLERIRSERDELLQRQRELEDRLARLEAQSHGGQLTFVDEGPVEDPENVVEFSRVDLGGTAPQPAEEEADEEEIMEFSSLGTQRSAFESPDERAWDDEAWPDEEPAWDAPESDWEEGSSLGPQAVPEREEVAWPDDEPAVETRWEDVDAGADWDAEGADEEGRRHAETGAEGDLNDLDEKTRADLSELEAQLQDLERELAKRPRRQADDDED